MVVLLLFISMRAETEYNKLRKGLRKEPLTAEEYTKLKTEWAERDRVNRLVKKYILARRSRQNKHRARRVFWRLVKAIKKRDKSATITPMEVWSIAKRQKLKCALSGRQLTSTDISPDHIIPFSKGGKSDKSNIRLVTKQVNIMRHIMSDEELISLCNDIVRFSESAH